MASLADSKGARGSTYTFKDRRQDAGEMWDRASYYHAELREIYRYFMPFREPTIERLPDRGGPGEGQKRTQYLFDSTGPSAAASFVAHMKSDWLPAFDDFFKIQNGPLYVAANPDAAAQRAEELQTITKVLHALLAPVRLTCDEMFLDYFSGTGAMYLPAGKKDGAIPGVSVPTLEIALDNGPYGNVDRWLWKRNRKARHIEQLWPDGRFSDRLARLMKDNRNADVLVHQFTFYDHHEDVFRLSVWCDGDVDCEFHSEVLQTSPWMTPRFLVVPGEPMGRGLAHLGLPTVKTLNKARELALRAAAFALLGLWTRRNDGVFNPETAVMAPGNMWKVAYSDGPLKTISRLDVPHNFDIASVIIRDEREQLRRVLLDDELPELQDSVRTPTEIAGRMRRFEKNRGGSTTRLALELITPMVQRGIDIMGKRGLLPGNLRVDQLLTQATIAAPAAAAMRADKVERIVSWIQIMTGILGPQATALIAKLEDIMPEIGRDLGVEEKHIRRNTQVEQLKMLVDTAVAAAVEQERASQKGAPQQAAPNPKEIAQQFVNGGYA